MPVVSYQLPRGAQLERYYSLDIYLEHHLLARCPGSEPLAYRLNHWNPRLQGKGRPQGSLQYGHRLSMAHLDTTFFLRSQLTRASAWG